MNRLGVHALVFVPGWSAEEARGAIEISARCGYDLIEIPLLDPSSVDPYMTRGLLDEYGIGATCSLGLDFDTDISSEDEAIARKGEDLLLRAVTVAAELGADYLGGVTYCAMGKYSQSATERGRGHAIEALGRVCSHAADAGVTIGIEVVNRYESNLLNTARQATIFADDVGASNLVVHLDTYHMNIEEGRMDLPVQTCGDRLGYVHVGESHRGYLGSGSVDFPSFFRALIDADYQGVITFESFSSRVISDAFASALAVWRDLWEDGEDLAVHARQFITDQLLSAGRAR